ncbi:elongation factor G [Candidatus Vidania fulgoroideorum]
MKTKLYRNIGICAHIDAGKTTLTERILFYTGINYKIGEVHDGCATMDFMDQEKERGITISSACITTYWNGAMGNIKNHKINIIDTPGHVDFTAEVERSMRVLDGMILVLCGVGGIQPQTENIWRQINYYKVPRIVFVNKMDRPGARYNELDKTLEQHFGIPSITITIPTYTKDVFDGVIDILTMKKYIFDGPFGKDICIINQKEDSDLKRMRDNIIEKIISYDDKLIDKYINNEDISLDEIYQCLRNLVCANKMIAMFCGSAFKNKGVQVMMDYIIHLLPSPKDKKEIVCYIGNKKELLNIKSKEIFSALVFKIVHDSFMGKLSFIRIYTGIIKLGDMIINYRTNEKVRVGRILVIKANRREDISSAQLGDIVAIPGLGKQTTGDTLCKLSDHKEIFLEKISFPDPVIALSLIPNDKKDQERLMCAAKQIAAEDPSIRINIDKRNSNIIISGMGELHLDVFVERIRREYRIGVQSTLPSVAYKETIKKRINVEGKYIKQSGGRGQYGHILICVEPRGMGEGFLFVNRIKGGVIPNEYIPSIDRGIREACKKGGYYNFPITDIKVTLYDGSYHEIDSNENSFRVAAALALKEAIRKGGTLIIEPIMNVYINVPDQYVGVVISNICSRRGIVISSECVGKITNIVADIPLNEMFKYATFLRSMTQGKGLYYMKFKKYGVVPEENYGKVI